MSNIIEIKGLSKRYSDAPKAPAVLSDISLSIEAQDIFGIIGLSGAGKSTLIRCLASLITPTAGSILVSGLSIHNLSSSELKNFRQQIGMIFQHFNLLRSRTVGGNISLPLEISGMPKEERETRVKELLRLVGLSEKEHSYPNRLSGGEKQRVGIARALANNPRVLLCDEATSALDPKTTQEILQLLKDINQKLGVTIVLITHEMEVVKQICNKVAVIEAGEIVEEGLVSEVFVDPKHETTQQFLLSGQHEVPREFFKPASPNRVLLRLSFKSGSAEEPLISAMVKRFGVDANILLGWVDKLQGRIVGMLIIELCGTPEGIAQSKNYLLQNNIRYEELLHER